MRLETKNLQTRLDDLAASDERTASTVQTLISYIDTLARAIETNREENKRSVDRTADIINGELDSLRKELTAVVDKLRGDKEPDADAEIEIAAPKKSKKATEENVTQFPAAATA